MISKAKLSMAAFALAALTATSSPASASIFGFSFGMDSNGPFFMMKDGPRFWHFNMYHPFGRYGDERYYRRPGTGLYQYPFSGYGRQMWPNSAWQNPYGRTSAWNLNPWRGYGLGRTPYGYGGIPGVSPFSMSPYRYGMMPGSNPFGASPFGYGMNPMTGVSPFGGSPFGGSPFGYGMNPMTGVSPFGGSPFGGFRPF